jgi:hypothetical protein
LARLEQEVAEGFARQILPGTGRFLPGGHAATAQKYPIQSMR